MDRNSLKSCTVRHCRKRRESVGRCPIGGTSRGCSGATKSVPELTLDGHESSLRRPSFGQYVPAMWSRDRKSTRLNSSHSQISYAVFCLKKKTHKNITQYYEMRQVQKRTLFRSVSQVADQIIAPQYITTDETVLPLSRVGLLLLTGCVIR